MPDICLFTAQGLKALDPSCLPVLILQAKILDYQGSEEVRKGEGHSLWQAFKTCSVTRSLCPWRFPRPPAQPIGEGGFGVSLQEPTICVPRVHALAWANTHKHI